MPLNILPFGSKALESIRGCGFLTVWEGSVRSMKTTASLVAWLGYILKSDENVFVMTGATQGSVYRNCIASEYGLLALAGGSLKERTDRNNSKYLEIAGGEKRIYYFGGESVSSYKLFRGATYGGWYADEVNNQHQNTVVEGFNRTAASRERKHFWTLNPDIPTHWIYKQYIEKYKEQQLAGFRYYHFTLDDNPAISEERKQELSRQYTGVMFQRYILGMRVRAEGIIYTGFSDENIVRTPEMMALIKRKIRYIEFGADIGGNKSATTGSAVGYWVEPGVGLCACGIDELYDTENASTEAVINNLCRFIADVRAEYKGIPAVNIYVDSAEQLILKSLRNKGIGTVLGSLKKPIIDRIRMGDSLFSQKRLLFYQRCKNTIDAFRSAVWNEKTAREERLDDGTTNIDSIDATEYTLERHMREFL